MKTDIEIANSVTPQPIEKIAEQLNISKEDLYLYGPYKAKLNLSLAENRPSKGKLILVTAINPTPAGEGKTTTTVGLGDALAKAGHRTVIALREPSLGPVFGIKGGATGGGYAQVIPMEDINLHFTGDMHAITAANNLLAAAIDNHIHQGNALGIDPRRIIWKRCLDMNDRALRKIVCSLGGPTNGMPREEGFDITVASEVMAILCLAKDLEDLKTRLGRIVVAENFSGDYVLAKDLEVQGAMAMLLKDALKPNLVQTLEHTPAIIHGGPFANIAHGCNSVTATKMALAFGDIAVTEAGFGADLGAEKFFDIKCRYAGLTPDAVVVVATVRALKYNGGVPKSELEAENLLALEKGLPNLLRHLDNIQNVYGLPAVVAINRFPTDTEAEIKLIRKVCERQGVEVALSEVWAKGSAGGAELAKAVLSLLQAPRDFRYAYQLEAPIEVKIRELVQKIYHGRDVTFSKTAQAAIAHLTAAGYAHLPICMAKTQYSFSDDAAQLGAPEGFTVTVQDLHVSAGAGFIVVLCGNILTMPGLPKKPAANQMDIDADGTITGLF